MKQPQPDFSPRSLRDLELMWDAGYEEGQPENVADEGRRQNLNTP